MLYHQLLLSRSTSCLLGASVRRSFSTNSTSQAFLQPVPSNPAVACLFLNRPQTKNAISTRMLQEFRECLDNLKFDKSVRTLIIRSTASGSFCAGADLIERRTMTLVQINKFLVDLRSALSELESLPMPTIAAIDGPALGGGLELSFACDLRVAAHDVTKIGLPEVRLGIIPGAGGTQRAVRLLGLSKAKDLVFTARMLTAVEALEWGVVDYISTPPSSAYDRALLLAQDIAKNAPLALRAAKQAISRAGDLSLESGLDFERASYELLLTTKDRTEALEAFKAKRPPVFRGE
ncbi:ClpP/crotonase-like domain-containing protein [Butyriboletus roseoflavus]|nr:ClpP/crotonase-like domain-containing protein [Butyriboletus roseoflavus]